jgi:hypothetical protein
VFVTVLPAGVSTFVTAGEGDSGIPLATIPFLPLLLWHDVLAHSLDGLESLRKQSLYKRRP